MPSEPEGLPDVAKLTELASAFFASLPGARPPVDNPAPGGFAPGPLAQGPALPGMLAPGANVLPQSTQSAQAQAASLPALTPKAAAPNGLPDLAALVLPAVNGRFGGHALAAPPVAAPAPQSASPYYFLGDQSGPAAGRSDLAEPQSFGLPGAGALKELLAGHQPSSGTGDYYFLPAVAKPAETSAPHRGLDLHAIRRDFPILQERVNGRPLVWFDNAATTQKPRQVIERLTHFYEHENSNIHRAAHELAARWHLSLIAT